MIEPDERWEPDYWLIPREDPFAEEPWRHDWARWLSTSMSVSTEPSAALSWTATNRWNLACRFSLKTPGESVFRAIQWFGPFVDTGFAADDPSPRFVGYILDDSYERPLLVWARSGGLALEDLNTVAG